MAIKENIFLYIHWKYMITKLFGYQQSSQKKVIQVWHDMRVSK